jgi:hypothetical protein
MSMKRRRRRRRKTLAKRKRLGNWKAKEMKSERRVGM